MNVSAQELFAQLGSLYVETQMLRRQIAELTAKLQPATGEANEANPAK